MKSYTDHKWKPFKHREEMPEKVLQEYFGHLPEEMDGFFCYRKRWYHISDFMRISGSAPFPEEWQGYYSDSYFSGVLIRVSSDGETYQAATYIS